MSLDRQRILNELGSVMNQLKSVDCGCMGKLFSNQSQRQHPMSAPCCGGCRRRCCNENDYNQSPSSVSEPYAMSDSMNHSNKSCMMGHCNPSKLYADTYGYLNDNLMQPVVKEVYDDLKSINPTNTIMNNPLAHQMGFSGDSANMVHGGKNCGDTGNSMQKIAGSDQLHQPTSLRGSKGGMGPQIVNMIMGDTNKNPNSTQQIIQQGIKSNRPIENATVHPGQYSSNMSNMNQQNMNRFADPATHFVSNDNNIYSLGAAQGPMIGNNNQNGNANGNFEMVNTNITNIPGRTENANLVSQQTPISKPMQYGQHNRGMKKFNEMFPGVMQGGDLGFDPMAIAIQMNPANKQKAAIDTMQRLMSGGPAGQIRESSGNLAARNANETAVESMNPGTFDHHRQNFAHSDQISNQEDVGHQQVLMQQNSPPIQAINGQAIAKEQQSNALPQQQMYTAITEQPFQYQQQEQAEAYQPSLDASKYNQKQHYVDPTAGEFMSDTALSLGQQGILDPNAQAQSKTQDTSPADKPLTRSIMKEPIFPAFREQEMNYTKMFHHPEPTLPQTLSPQLTKNLRKDYGNYSNVKSTVSKTSLAANKPEGRTPSRNQLQHIYNQYKGSQSFTQQNVQSPVQGGTHSDGKVNLPPSVHARQQVPLERIAGDTVANNQINFEKQNKLSPLVGEEGDIPTANKAYEDTKDSKLPISTRQNKLRNGLQDVIYTSYQSSAAWSFHGTSNYRPTAGRYRL